MSFRNPQDENKANIDNIKTLDDRPYGDFNLDNVSSEDDDFEPVSGIVKRMIENNKDSIKLLNSLGVND